MGLTKNLGWLSKYITADSSGQIGIGTTSPSAKLEVVGDIKLSGSDVTAFLGSGTNYAAVKGETGNIRFYTGTGTYNERMQITSGGEVQIKSGASDTVLSFINNASGAARSITYGVATAAINITGTSGSSQVTILNGGNVGIGTTSPAMKLQVGDGTGTGNQYIRLYSSATDMYIGQTGSNLFAAGNGQVIVTDNTYTSNLAIGTLNPSANLIFGTASTERMRITSGGNVGIGISPQWNLDTYRSLEIGLTGLIYARTTTDSQTMVVGSNLYYNSGWKAKTTGAGSLIAQNAGNITFETSNSVGAGVGTTITERMRIFNNGNVLIGSGATDAGYKLDVNGSGRFSGDIVSTGVVSAAGTGGFASSTYAVGVRNPIWRFGNADGYGMSYFQGTAGYGGGDSIGFHFGTPTAANSQFNFLSNGNWYFSGSNLSDARAKENVNDITFNATEKVMALQSRSYYMKSNNNKLKYGFIAQEVHKVLPDLISGNINGEELIGLDYNGLIPVLVKAIQELTERIKTLENK